MRPLPVPCHRGVLHPHTITRQLCRTSAQLLSAPPSRRCIHHTAPLCRNTPLDYLAEIRKSRASESAEPTAPWREREPPNEADKSSTTEPDRVEQRRVVYNKDGHEPSIHRYMSNPGDRIPSPLPLRYSLSDSGGWGRKVLSPKEPLTIKEAPAREEAAPPEEFSSVDPLMLFYNQISPAKEKGNSESAAVGSESRPETGGIAAEARSAGPGLLAKKEQQLNEKERKLEDLERRLNELALKLEEKSEGKGKEQGEAGVREAGVREAGIREAGVREAAVREAGIREAGIREAAVREAAVREAPGPQNDQLHWAAVKKARLAEETRLRDPPANIEIRFEELKTLGEKDSLAAHKEVMTLAALKRQQLEKDIIENPASKDHWPRRVDNELRKWVIEHNLHTLIHRKPRDERRQEDFIKRQRLVARKKLRISPDVPDPVTGVEAAVHSWITQRDAQMVVRKSKEFVRKRHKRHVLAQRAELNSIIAAGLTDVGDFRRGRIIAGMRRKEERKAKIEAKKQRKAAKKAVRESGLSYFADPGVPSQPPTNQGSSRESTAAPWAPVDRSRFRHTGD